MSDLVGNPEDRFSHVVAHMVGTILSSQSDVDKVYSCMMIAEDC